MGNVGKSRVPLHILRSFGVDVEKGGGMLLVLLTADIVSEWEKAGKPTACASRCIAALAVEMGKPRGEICGRMTHAAKPILTADVLTLEQYGLRLKRRTAPELAERFAEMIYKGS